MKRAAICLWMMLKRMGKHPAYRILLLLFPAAIFAVPKFNRAAEEEQILVGYVAEEAGWADPEREALYRSLQFTMLSEDIFKYIKYTDKDKMKEDIATGELSCGVFFDGEFAERLKEQDYRHCIKLYLPEGMNVGGMVQEDVFKRVYQAYSAVWYAELLADQGYRTEPEKVLRKFAEYQEEGKLFAVDYEVYEEGGGKSVNAGEGIGKEQGGAEGVPVLSLRSALAFLTLLSASLGALDAGRDRKRELGEGMRNRRILYRAAAGAPILTATLFLAGGMLFHTINAGDVPDAGLQTQILPEIGSALLYGFILWLLAMLVSRFIPVKLLEGAMPCFLLAVLLCCPVFFDLGETIPLFGHLSKVFPITWYLRFWG